jgi:murein L,D-transpeptidase YafK
VLAVIIAVMGVSVGCTATPAPPVEPTVQPVGQRDELAIDRFRLALVVHKSRQILGVYHFGEVVKEYPVVVGRRPDGHKLYEGDLRTPEGMYRIMNKRPHARWKYFLELDYPNSEDIRRYQDNVRDGRIPTFAQRPLAIGGNIGIHGTDREEKQRRGVNWTKGCIALNNRDISILYSTVKLGTPVFVLP